MQNAHITKTTLTEINSTDWDWGYKCAFTTSSHICLPAFDIILIISVDVTEIDWIKKNENL